MHVAGIFRQPVVTTTCGVSLVDGYKDSDHGPLREIGFEPALGWITFLNLLRHQSSWIDTIEGRRINAAYEGVKFIEEVLERLPSF